MKRIARRLKGLKPSRLPYPALFLVLLLSAALVFGGASRLNPIAQAVLCTLAAFTMLATIAPPGGVVSPRRYPIVTGLIAALVAITLLQLVPLPLEIWTALPGREEIANGFALLGLAPPSLPLSVTPEDTKLGVLWFIPPIAIVLLTLSSSWDRVSRIARLFPMTAALATSAFGFMQFFSGPKSPLYFHAFSNTTYPIGVFANANHQSIFLVMCLPFLAAIAGRWRQKWKAGTAEAGRLYIIGLIIIWTIIAIVAAGSLAGYILGVATLLVSSVLIFGRRSSLHPGVLTFALVVVAGAVMLTFTSPLLSGLGMGSYFGEGLSREATHKRTLEAISDHFPAGSGMGSFEAVFQTYEDPDQVTRTFMNHAHGDYLEFVLEYGVLGVLLLVSFLVWFFWLFIRVWSTKFDAEGERLRKAASLSIAALLIHSLVDYPVRTAAIACFAAFCLALMAYRIDEPDGRPVKRRRRETSSQGQDISGDQVVRHEEL